jgi:hypothetical protein
VRHWKRSSEKTAGAYRPERGLRVRLGRFSSERTQGLQAVGRRLRQLSVRAEAGSERGTSRRTGQAGRANAALWLSEAACSAGVSRTRSQREESLSAVCAGRRGSAATQTQATGTGMRGGTAADPRQLGIGRGFNRRWPGNGRMVRILSVINAFTRACLGWKATQAWAEAV